METEVLNPRCISGIRPTGRLHLGNYIGSIQPALKYEADVLIAEYHAPYGNVVMLANELKHYFKPNKIKFQSDQFNARLFFEMLESTPTGLLRHMPQYKEKDKNALMFTYPVLMAQDIAEYDYVIVGDDQKPHIEFAKDILVKMGYTCPKPIYEGGRVMDLRHPENKMSKSAPSSCLFLKDTPEEAYKKIRKAVTTDAGLANLHFIYRTLSGSTAQPSWSNETLKEKIFWLVELILIPVDKHLDV